MTSPRIATLAPEPRLRSAGVAQRPAPVATRAVTRALRASTNLNIMLSYYSARCARPIMPLCLIFPSPSRRWATRSTFASRYALAPSQPALARRPVPSARYNRAWGFVFRRCALRPYTRRSAAAAAARLPLRYAPPAAARRRRSVRLSFAASAPPSPRALRARYARPALKGERCAEWVCRAFGVFSSYLRCAFVCNSREVSRE